MSDWLCAQRSRYGSGGRFVPEGRYAPGKSSEGVTPLARFIAMGFWASYTSAFRRYGDFEGRTSRGVFWRFFLVNLGISLSLVLALVLVLTSSTRTASVASSVDLPPLAYALLMAAGLYGLAVFIPALAIQVRRLHDVGRSGWWVLLGVIGIFGLIPLIIWWAAEGQGLNAWGPGSVDADEPPRSPGALPAIGSGVDSEEPAVKLPADVVAPPTNLEDVLKASGDASVAGQAPAGGAPQRPLSDLDALLAGGDGLSKASNQRQARALSEEGKEPVDTAHQALRAMIDERTGGA